MMLMFKIKAYAQSGSTSGRLSNGSRITRGTGTFGRDANGNVTFTPRGASTTTTWNNSSNSRTRGRQTTNGRTRG